MIIKHCDICGHLIKGKNELKLSDGFYKLKFVLTKSGSQLEINCKALIDEDESIFDFCKYCLLDALYKCDDRDDENKD